MFKFIMGVGFVGACALAACAMFGHFLVYLNTNNGIIPSDDGNAVLIQGEACVVNDLPTIGDNQFLELLAFCYEHRHDRK